MRTRPEYVWRAHPCIQGCSVAADAEYEADDHADEGRQHCKADEYAKKSHDNAREHKPRRRRRAWSRLRG